MNKIREIKRVIPGVRLSVIEEFDPEKTLLSTMER